MFLQLGIPTANIPLEGLSVGGQEDLESGIYYGWAGLDFGSPNLKDDEDKSWEGYGRIHPMVMSVGWNPFYGNTRRSVVCFLPL